MSQASYSIKDVKASYNRCTVTVATSNIDYSEAVKKSKEDLSSTIESLSSPEGWWSGIRNWFSSFFGEAEKEGEEEKTPMNGLADLMEEYIREQEPVTVTGTIIYGIRDRKWTLISVDPSLFYNYYGFPQKTEE